MPLGSLMRTFFPLIHYKYILRCAYSDRDAKQKWANSMGGAWGIGGLGGQLIAGAAKNAVSRVFRG